MKVIKSKQIKASDLKRKFNSKYPFLKIEFFKSKHKTLEGSLKKDLIVDDFIIDSNNPIIEFEEEMLVSDLENQFAEKLKLYIQVFRKSGKSWLETTYTDSWSLKKQNQEGVDLSKI
ncbi:MAG: hypothetical protein ACK50L_12840 [Bacteroidota bacterium]